MDYESFLMKKSQIDFNDGFEPLFMPDYLFEFQRSMAEWSIRKGRAALFEDCGLGKTVQELVWAENVARHTGGNVLILTPLSVSHQFVTEGEKFGVEVKRSNKGEVHRISVTNYEKLHLFDWKDWSGVVCDESAILKNFKGKLRLEISIFMRKIRYRLLATATPSPNDYPELGTSSEALGYLGHVDMLNKFFKNNLNNSAQNRFHGETIKFVLKGHAEQAFWRWVCSWARAIRKPSDLGFGDDGFILPSLNEEEFVVEANTVPDGFLFSIPAYGMKEQREERRRTIEERCEKVASLVNDTGQPAIVWCHLNPEGDLLEKLIPGCVQVSGKDSDDSKEEKLISFATGGTRILVTKPVIGAWGLNFQHCNHMTFFPSHSFEQYYQGVRRCWRFGQKRPVKVDIITTEGEQRVLKNLQRKAEQADRMFENLCKEMNNVLSINKTDKFTEKEVMPAWL